MVVMFMFYLLEIFQLRLVVQMANSSTSNYFSFVLYCEDWAIHEVFDCCTKSDLPCYISPKHEKDYYVDDDLRAFLFEHNKKLLKGCKDFSLDEVVDICKNCDAEFPDWNVGDYKKPHWHILVQLPQRYGVVNGLRVLQDYFPLLEIRYCKLASYDWACKYWSHLNAPKKAQYDPKDALCINGFVPDLRKVEPYKPKSDIILDLMAYINSTPCCTLYKTIYHFRELGAYNVIEYIEKHTYLVCRLIDDQKV